MLLFPDRPTQPGLPRHTGIICQTWALSLNTFLLPTPPEKNPCTTEPPSWLVQQPDDIAESQIKLPCCLLPVLGALGSILLQKHVPWHINNTLLQEGPESLQGQCVHQLQPQVCTSQPRATPLLCSTSGAAFQTNLLHSACL